MGAVFAISCMAGKEINTKELLKQRLAQHDVDIVKRISANETHTDFINGDTNEINISEEVTNRDIARYMKIQNMRDAINNYRIQLEMLSRYTTDEALEDKRNIRGKINELEREIKKIGRRSRGIKSVLRGYILVELTMNSHYLPDHLWNIISSLSRECSTPIKMVSMYPILEHEVEGFFQTLNKEREAEVVMSFEKEKTYEELELEQKELLIKLNGLNKQSNINETTELEEELDELYVSVVDKVNEYLDEKASAEANHEYFDKVKAFIKRGKRIVSMPISLFNNLYSEEESLEIKKYLQERDFLTRFERFTTDIVGRVGR